MEAEFVAFCSTSHEGVWLKRFLDRLIDADDLDPVLVNCDSQAAITYTKDLKYHCKTKHIDIKYKFA